MIRLIRPRQGRTGHVDRAAAGRQRRPSAMPRDEQDWSRAERRVGPPWAEPPAASRRKQPGGQQTRRVKSRDKQDAAAMPKQHRIRKPTKQQPGKSACCQQMQDAEKDRGLRRRDQDAAETSPAAPARISQRRRKRDRFDALCGARLKAMPDTEQEATGDQTCDQIAAGRLIISGGSNAKREGPGPVPEHHGDDDAPRSASSVAERPAAVTPRGLAASQSPPEAPQRPKSAHSSLQVRGQEAPCRLRTARHPGFAEGTEESPAAFGRA